VGTAYVQSILGGQMEGLILTEEQLIAEVDYFMQQDAFVFDIESMDGEFPGTRGIPSQNRVVWISLATYGRTIIIPLGHPNGDVVLQKAHTKNKVFYPLVFDAPPVQLRPSVAFRILKPLFFSPTIRKIAHNVATDFVSLHKYYGEFPCAPRGDTIVLQWSLDENIGKPMGGPKRPMGLGLKILTRWYYGVDYDKEGIGKCIEAHPFSKVAYYGLMDARYTWLLWLQLDRRCREEGLVDHRALEEELFEALFSMNLVGAPMDVAALQQLEVELTELMTTLETKIYREAGRFFNLNSPKQRCEILYGSKEEGNQGLKATRLTDGGLKKKKAEESLTIFDYSTDKKAMEAFPSNPLVKLLLEYSEMDKLRGTYVRGYLGNPEADKPSIIFHNRIHADLCQYGTATSRFSCRAPNLQNVPRPDKPLGKKVRGLFRAPEGYSLVVADYGQIEYRVLAHFIGHGVLFDGFHNGIDAHKATAAALYQVSIEEVTKEMRSAAKTLGFGILFGAGEESTAALMGKPLKYVQNLFQEYAKTQPEVNKFKSQVVSTARRRDIPHIVTLTGFVRRVWDLNDQRWGIRGGGERQIFNSLIQGSAAGLIKMAMVRVYNTIKESNKGYEEKDWIHLVLSVHDELVLQAPNYRAEEAKLYLEDAMAGPEMQKLLKVPLEAEAMLVNRWSEAKE
jgi:DNA polymerase I-like protein with 3'-5' exonuclease and polymerase domains